IWPWHSLCSLGFGWVGGIDAASHRRVGPGNDDPAADEAEHPEGRDAEEDGQDQSAVHLLALQSGLVVGDQYAEAGVAAPEEEVADDGADDRQPGRDAQAG